MQHTPVTFIIENLDQAATYRMIIFAINVKGRSEPIIIDDINFKGVAKLTGQFTELKSSLKLQLATGFIIIIYYTFRQLDGA